MLWFRKQILEFITTDVMDESIYKRGYYGTRRCLQNAWGRLTIAVMFIKFYCKNSIQNGDMEPVICGHHLNERLQINVVYKGQK